MNLYASSIVKYIYGMQHPKSEHDVRVSVVNVSSFMRLIWIVSPLYTIHGIQCDSVDQPYCDIKRFSLKKRKSTYNPIQ